MAKRPMNGTFTRVWVDGILVAGLTGFQAKYDTKRDPIVQCGDMVEDSKLLGAKGSGSLAFDKIYTMDREDIDKLTSGIDPRHTIVGELADPDAWGAERYAFYNCWFDEYTLIDAEAAKYGKVTMPFGFTRDELLDSARP